MQTQLKAPTPIYTRGQINRAFGLGAVPTTTFNWFPWLMLVGVAGVVGVITWDELRRR